MEQSSWGHYPTNQKDFMGFRGGCQQNVPPYRGRGRPNWKSRQNSSRGAGREGGRGNYAKGFKDMHFKGKLQFGGGGPNGRSANPRGRTNMDRGNTRFRERGPSNHDVPKNVTPSHLPQNLGSSLHKEGNFGHSTTPFNTTDQNQNPYPRGVGGPTVQSQPVNEKGDESKCGGVVVGGDAGPNLTVPAPVSSNINVGGKESNFVELDKYRDGRGCWQPDGMSLTGGSGAARFRGHVKSLYSAGEKVRVTEGPRV